MKPLYLFANWKMYLDHGESIALAKDLVKQLPALALNAQLAVFPSSVALVGVKDILKKIKVEVGPQNVYWIEKGGYTGEVSALMYKNILCRYALVGHSERRHVFNESNSEVRQKQDAILNVGMVPVLCVGETLQERKNGEVQMVIEAQLRAAFTDVVWPKDRELIIAYEPVWAVSTGESCDPDEAERVAAGICQCVEGLTGLVPAVLYGGSVRPDNVSSYVAKEHINGVLVGGASTKMESWMEILDQVKA